MHSISLLVLYPISSTTDWYFLDVTFEPFGFHINFKHYSSERGRRNNSNGKCHSPICLKIDCIAYWFFEFSTQHSWNRFLFCSLKSVYSGMHRDILALRTFSNFVLIHAKVVIFLCGYRWCICVVSHRHFHMNVVVATSPVFVLLLTLFVYCLLSIYSSSHSRLFTVRAHYFQRSCWDLPWTPLWSFWRGEWLGCRSFSARNSRSESFLLLLWSQSVLLWPTLHLYWSGKTIYLSFALHAKSNQL